MHSGTDYNRPDDQQLEAACSIRIVELRCIAYTVIRAVDAGAQRQHQQVILQFFSV
jgi:hypothetical protein